MGAFQGAATLLPRPLADMAEHYHYSPENRLILAGDGEALRRQFPRCWENLLSCTHQRDRRTPMEYARDLVVSWLVEDHFMELLREAGFRVSGAGADRTRTLLASSRVSSSSDFLVTGNGAPFRVEFMCDYTGYWAKAQALDLRDNKFDSLCREHSVFLGIDALHRAAIVLDFRGAPPQVVRIASHPPYGGKPACRLSCPRERFFPLTPQELAVHLGG